jgi:nitrate/TMAO reductase-like tetraheme cytochrome c subunit
VAGLCGRCHADSRITGTYFATPDKERARTAVAHFHTTVHGTALTRAGLVVSATCNDCHRAHKVLPVDSSGSSVNRANIPATCGACHVGVAETYDSSAHGRAYRNGGATNTGHPAPVCVDCHSAHEIVRADQPQWLLGVVEECGTCHERLYETYFETYHGKVTRLGFNLAATCADCHTAHDMRPASDTRSSVYAENLVATCGRCHANANANFVRYQPHGDPKERTKYPLLFWTSLFMTTLLVSVMAFFLLHTLLWVTRLAINRRRGRGRAHEEPR